jgi:outer membrane receptor protein involved in Fe transport
MKTHQNCEKRVILLLMAMCLWSATSGAQQTGSIRGTVCDREDDTPLAAAQVLIAETGAKAAASNDGGFVFGQVAPGKYTLVFSKDGYTRQVAADVVVEPGRMTDANATMLGEYTEMDEFVVQKLETGGGTEEGLLNLRMESPALMDSVSSDLMSRAGAGDAASALKLVAGASVQDGKYAVVRGLPDRYVSSQMNGVRLPTADADKRAVQLDQFPSALIESIQVSKTFTPDQQGDASGGAVNVVLKGVPDENILKFKIGTEYNTQTPGKGDFLTYKGGGITLSGQDDGIRDPQPPGTNWHGAVGVSRGDAPMPYNWELTAGGKHEVLDGLKVGGMGNFYYKQNSSSYDGGVNDTYGLTKPGDPMRPETKGAPSSPVGTTDDFRTSLFDVSKSSAEVQWGGLGSVGIETEDHKLTALFMRTQSTKDTATLAEDTRGKKDYVTDHVPGYDPMAPANGYYEAAAPYQRSETLEYVERKTETFQLHGDHTLKFPEVGLPGYFVLLPPGVDWTVAQSSSGLSSPDKRQFASRWIPGQPAIPAYGIPATPSRYEQNPSESSFGMGGIQRIWKEINEDSIQYFVNGKQPFEQWSGDKGYLKVGVFNDKVNRDYKQDSFLNSDFSSSSPGDWSEYWSSSFPYENHPMEAAEIDVNYKGKQDISAWYYMADVPFCSVFKVVGGIRHEQTDLSTILDPDSQVYASNGHGGSDTLDNIPGKGSAQFSQKDVLPALGFEFKPVDPLILRASYSETVARQTFKELTPIQQSEYLGGDIFLGNQNLGMSALKNYDLRADYTPFEGSLVSVSWFYKKIKDPIEYVQDYIVNIGPVTTPVNYPEGELSGYELEVRQQLDRFWDPLDGLAVGANATFIQSQVTLSTNEAKKLSDKGFPEPTRDMLNAPEHLYNLNLTYDIKKTGTQLGLFYTVQGDTLVAGSGISKNGKLIPDVYAKEYGTLNFSVSQKIGEHLKLTFQAKNLNDPEIQQVSRSDYAEGGDGVKTSYKKGIDFSISLGGEF